MSLNLVIDPALAQAFTHALVVLSQSAPMRGSDVLFFDRIEDGCNLHCLVNEDHHSAVIGR